MAQIKALVIKDPRTAVVRLEDLPKYVSSPRAGWEAYLAYCHRTRSQGTLGNKRTQLTHEIEKQVAFIRRIADSIARWQKELNAARANETRCKRLIAEGIKADPTDLAIYAQEFDSIANLEGVAEIGISQAGRMFVIFKPRRQMQNGKWCDFGDWKIYPGTVKVDTERGHRGVEDYDGTAIRLRDSVATNSNGAYPHDGRYFCWGDNSPTMNLYLQKGHFFEILSHASQALMTYRYNEEASAQYFEHLKADDRPTEVKIDPAARQHYIDAKMRVGSNHKAALREAQDVIASSEVQIKEWGPRSKTEREKLANLKVELAEVERLIAEDIDPEIAWRQEYDALLASPDLLAIKVYEYDGLQTLKFVIRARHQTRRGTYYLGDYEIDFRVSRYGLEDLVAVRLNSGLIPEAQNNRPYSIHQEQRPKVYTNEVKRFRVDAGEMFGMLRAIIEYLSTPGDLRYPARSYFALSED